ncbi:MAG: LssY C-terminal domain-containing protein [Bryobacterales bacterium]|nr:LssY C-terminal domain-containing protein [Bryobacterales bacterium]
MIVGLLILMAARARAGVPEVEVRLESHLTSYATKAGTEFSAIVISPLESYGEVLMPPGTRIWGRVQKASAIGYGIRRERASLDLEFREYELADGRRYPLEAALHTVSNAREEVTRDGRVRGILAADSPYGLLSSVWLRPSLNVPASLTSATGMVWTRMALGPMGTLGLIGVRMLVLRWPEPEIHMPPGTEMKLAIVSLPADAPRFPVEVCEPLDAGIQNELLSRSHLVSKPDGRMAQDIINVAFVGTRDQLVRSFELAGWSTAETMTRRSFARSYKALTRRQGYSTAPVSLLLHENKGPDLVFQKSWNTLSKRHHVRIWNAGMADGRELWVGAGTHDVGFIFDRRAVTFTHQIDPRIDSERAKIVNDLTYAACTEHVHYLDRREAIRRPTGRPGVRSDGALAVVALQNCNGKLPGEGLVVPKQPGGALKLLTRRLLLETRHTILRGNVVYLAYRAFRWRTTGFQAVSSVAE